MTRTFLLESELSLHLTSSGYVRLESARMDVDDNLALFGPDGPVPPVSISALTVSLLETITAAPDDTDAADLRLLHKSLKASLAQVETTLAQLEGSGD